MLSVFIAVATGQAAGLAAQWKHNNGCDGVGGELLSLVRVWECKERARRCRLYRDRIENLKKDSIMHKFVLPNEETGGRRDMVSTLAPWHALPYLFTPCDHRRFSGEVLYHTHSGSDMGNVVRARTTAASPPDRADGVQKCLQGVRAGVGYEKRIDAE